MDIIYFRLPRMASSSITTSIRQHNIAARRGEKVALKLNFLDGKDFKDCILNPNPDFYKNKIKTVYKDIWDSSLKIAVSRNPWDRAISMWNHIYFKKFENFEDFCDNLGLISAPEELFHILPFSDFLYDGDEFLVDKIIDINDVDAELEKITKEHFNCSINLGRNNCSKRDTDYRIYYNDKTKEIISDFYKNDILRFNYEF